MKFQSIVLLIVVMCASSVKNEAIPLEGGRSVDVSDPHVIDIANFAVTEYNKGITLSKLKFVKVIKGESQELSGGINYHLTISASRRFQDIHNQYIHNYETVVLEKPSEHFRNLTSFKSVNA
ncbi:cysteine proteinase inhibitor 1-like [Trifolium pratense]|uniref:cysteine proteinase inhibitor 1-like n=1 Tax=Trifolium pratense TaxID=57577 RepID=UPI001E697C54|nr:cysteine proteinase inhibitor 1-like [Trifolium pratense]